MSQGEPLRVAFVSLGCPKNLVDSERMLALLAEAGCLVPAPMDEADVIVVNTCGFLAAARQEALEVLGEALARKAAGPAQRVVAAGCLVTRDGEGLFEALPGLDAIIGVNDREAIVAAVAAEGRFVRNRPYAGQPACSDLVRFRATPRQTAYLRIAEGCSHGCTFCTIPAIRGPFRSKRPEQVLAEARELISDGCRELNVIAQDTTSYGRDLDGWNLARLLRELNALDGARWIRLLYAYPRGIDDPLLDVLAGCEHVAPYVDVPLQHVNDAVLKRMGRSAVSASSNRRTGRAEIEAVLDALRRRVPGVTLRTTFIAGFPGETEGQFAELVEFVRAQRLDAVGVFAYSPEPGTPAMRLGPAVPAGERQRRAEALLAVQQEIAHAAAAARLGQEFDVLVDGVEADGRCVGRHAGQAPDIDGVCYLRRPAEPGTFVRARVVAADGYDLVVE